MKKILGITFLGVLFSTNLLIGQDMLPSDVYYKDNIAVNDVSARAPSLKDNDDDDDAGPGGSGSSSGGGGSWTGAPVGDAALPLLSIGLAYMGFILFRKSRKQANN